MLPEGRSITTFPNGNLTGKVGARPQASTILWLRRATDDDPSLVIPSRLSPAGRIGPLQRDNEGHGQTGLHIIVRQIPSGGLHSLGTHSNR
jgi:hypothetical protein